MGNKNSTNYQPSQIVNHLRQQYPNLNNSQLQQLYTRWYLRNKNPDRNNSQLNRNDIDPETQLHLSQIYQLINSESDGYEPYQGDRLPSNTNFRSTESDYIGQSYNQMNNDRGYNSNYSSNSYQPRHISSMQNAPSRHSLEEQYQMRAMDQSNFHGNNSGRRSNTVPPPPPAQNFSKRQQFEQEMSRIDPADAYRLFGLSPSFNLEQLKQSYRKLSLKTHPDRGGSSEKFQFVTRHYLFLVEEYKKNKPSLHFHDLKQSSQDFTQQQNQEPRRNIYFNDEAKNQSGNVDTNSGVNFDNKRFNEIYDQHRISNVHDEGYSDWISDTQLDEKDPEPIFSDKFNLSVFNNIFENEKDNNPQEQVIVYQEPQPTNIVRETGFSELGEDNISDFSGANQSGLGYTDYKKAHTQTRLINTRQVESRESFKNVEHLQRQRDQISFTMSPEDIKKEQATKKRLALEEKQRIERLRLNDNLHAENYERVNQLMINLR